MRFLVSSGLVQPLVPCEHTRRRLEPDFVVSRLDVAFAGDITNTAVDAVEPRAKVCQLG